MTYLWIIVAIVVVAAIGLSLYLVSRRGRGAVPRSRGRLAIPALAPRTKPRSDVIRSGSGVGTLAPPPPGSVTTPPVEGPEGTAAAGRAGP